MFEHFMIEKCFCLDQHCLTSSIPPGVEVENKYLMNSEVCLMSNAVEVMLQFQQRLYQWGFIVIY